MEFFSVLISEVLNNHYCVCRENVYVGEFLINSTVSVQMLPFIKDIQM